MTPRQRVECVLQGGRCQAVPFTVYEAKLPQSTVERELRNRGLCIVKRDVPVFRCLRPDVKVTREVNWEGDRQLVRTHYETPAGILSTLDQPAGFTTWHHEKMFKTPDDYKAILSLIRSERYEPCCDAFLRAQADFGDDAIFRTNFGLEPLQELISGQIMDMQTFCIEWIDRRDELLRLYEAVLANRRKVYPLIAASPVLHANYGGNVTPEIIGLETFEKYYVPHYNEAAEIMHRHGKLIGSHLDANCRLLSAAIAATDLDYIEAFSPAPDTDMTLADARAAWPDKVLWLNFPSSLQLKSDAAVEQATVDLLNELESVDGVIMGVTEDVPPERWQGGYRAIMDGLVRHAQENPQLYADASDS